jgi:long-chain acyl-CoA synthetase
MASIADILNDTTILMTGATGFVGKVVLHQLLRQAPASTCIICLVRSDVERSLEFEPEQSAFERFQRLVVRSECFRPMRRAGVPVDELVAERVRILAGDIGQPHLGLAPDRYRELAARTDLIINCAGATALDGPLDDQLSANTLGPDELLRLALAWHESGRRTPPALTHVSTCFVCGPRSGRIGENVIVDDYPKRDELGVPFFPGEEVQALQETVARTRAEVGVRSAGAERWLSQRLVAEGRARAGVWGWPNVHSFTKALGERALAAQHGDVPLSIVRLSIAGAAIRDPLPGWIEGTGPIQELALLAWRGQRCYPLHPERIVDVIPVDYAANAMIAIAAMTLAGQASGVYHLSSGERNALDARTFVGLTGKGLRRERGRRSRISPKIVSEKTYRRYSAPARARWLSRAATLLDRLPRRLSTRRADALRGRQREARFVESVFDRCRPIFDEQRVFGTDRTHDLYERLTPEDRERFSFAPQNIDWRRYWIDVEMDGILQHAFPAMGEERRPLYAALAGDSIRDLLDTSARRHGAKVALEIWSPDGMTQWTYRDLVAQIAASSKSSATHFPATIDRLATLAADGPVHVPLVNRVVALSASIELTSNDTVLALAPLHCDGALAASLLLPLARGARVLCLDLDPDTAEADWQSVQIGIAVGSTADLQRWKAAQARFGPQFRGFFCCDEI